jgi:hypothetical protein
MLSARKIKELAFNWCDEATYYFKEHELLDFVSTILAEFKKENERVCMGGLVTISRKDFDRANSVLSHEDQEPITLISSEDK